MKWKGINFYCFFRKMKTSDQDECVLCCREISIYAVGACDHPVCYICSARMRVLCETNECPICRSDMPLVRKRNSSIRR